MSRLGEIRLRVQGFVVEHFLRYDSAALTRALGGLGIARGDVLMVHASLGPHSGFQGRPVDMIRCLQESIGLEGLLVMPSMTYSDSSKNHLLRSEPMNARRSPSRMGLLSEVFRRSAGVQRSLSPTHPLLAWGSRAGDFIAGHDETPRPFGPDSPFQRLLDLDGKILCINAALETITFTHFLEDRIQHQLPFALYDSTLYVGQVVDFDGATRQVPTRVLSDESRMRRNESTLWKSSEFKRILRQKRLGNTTFRLVSCRSLAALVEDMYRTGKSLFES
jgi:aminoglycoside 3-N-acetyltransferase